MKVRKLGPTENQLHVSVANLLDWALLPPAFYSTFPSGWGKFSGALAQLLKKCGLKPGMPDILVFPGSGRCFGIELKTGRNTVSPEQRDTFIKLQLAGIRVYVCRSVEDVMITLLDQKVPMRNIKGDSWQRSTKEPLPVEIYARPVDGVATGENDGSR